MTKEVKAYILKLCCSFLQHEYVKNMVTGQVVTTVNVKMLLCCMKEGSNVHAKFVEDRLEKKTTSIHSTISRIKFTIPKETSRQASKVDIKDETIKLYYIWSMHDIAVSRLKRYFSMRSPPLHSFWLTTKHI